MRFTVLSIALCALIALAPRARAADAPPTYAKVNAIFAQRCLSCHDSKEAEGDLVMESYKQLMAGGEDGDVIIPGNADKSPMVRQLEHRDKPFMPPPKKAPQLAPEEIAVIRSWIDAGAPGPKPGEEIALAPTTAPAPHIAPIGEPRRPVQAIAYGEKSKLLAIARLGEVDLQSPDWTGSVRRLTGHIGNVNAVAFTTDGSLLAAAGGRPGVAGEVRIWNVATGALVRTLTGHKDSIYSVAISPDGHVLATGSYDQKITLWDLATGNPLRDLEGHNGAVFGLAFRPDSKVLASVSADRTLKLWDVATGKRLDTRPEPLKDQRAVVFSPDGKRVAACGNDNRIRIWAVGPDAVEGSNPLLVAQFAHPGAVLALAWSHDGKTLVSSADDGAVKVWDASSDKMLKQVRTLPPQSDWPTAVALVAEDKSVAVGRADGSVAIYDVTSGKEPPRPVPAIASYLPRGVQRGASIRVQVTGKNLGFVTGVRIQGMDAQAKLTARLLPDDQTATSAWIEFTAASDLPPGAYPFTLVGPDVESAAVPLQADDLPQLVEREPNDTPATANLVQLPCDFWGHFNQRGDSDDVAFDLKAGQTVVLDVGAQRFASKADVVLSVLDPAGRILAQGSRFDRDSDALLDFTAPSDGRYVVRITDLQDGASDDHFYRLSAGSFAYVTACYPLGVPAKAESRVRLIGLNLPPDRAWVTIKTGEAGEMDLPLDGTRFRSRRPIKVAVSAFPELTENYSIDKSRQPTLLPVPGAVSARIGPPGKDGTTDVGLFRFEAVGGQSYALETLAARRGSPIDTRIEVLHPDGRPVDRVQLQAVRDSSIAFRPIDAVVIGARFPNYAEFELNQYVYMNGEVVKLFLSPRGPDSEFNFYATGAVRRTYFDTTATAHALDEKCYIVEPHPPGEMLPSTGLPVFTLHYENDDDSDRKLGSDSRLLFTAPADGPYLVRVSDVRGFGGERFVYRLSVRPAKPDFKVTLDALNPRVPRGTGQSFTVRAERIDGFDGPISVAFDGVPPGFTLAGPLVIEAGHLEAQGTLYAGEKIHAPTTQAAAGLRAIASATIGGAPTTRPVTRGEESTELAKITVAPKPALRVWLEPYVAGGTTRPTVTAIGTGELPIIDVIPGKLVPAMLRIEHEGLTGPVTFQVDNLPHGVIVADIGLNGVLIPEGQKERQIFLSCASWVESTTRPCFARALQAGTPTSPPVLIHVRQMESASK